MTEIVARKGDLMRLSIELIREIADERDSMSVLVEIDEIRIEEDGTKTLVLQRAHRYSEKAS